MVNTIAIGLDEEINKYNQSEKFPGNFRDADLEYYRSRLASDIRMAWPDIQNEEHLNNFFDNLPSKLTQDDKQDDPFFTAYYEAAQKDMKLKDILEGVIGLSLNDPTLSPELRSIDKRTLKIGIKAMEAIKETPVQYYFVLDRLDMKKVVNKKYPYLKNDGSPEFYKPVLAEVLRSIYRNRESLGEKVVFFRNQDRVQAPWLENEKPWEKYQAKIEQKNTEQQKIVQLDTASVNEIKTEPIVLDQTNTEKQKKKSPKRFLKIFNKPAQTKTQEIVQVVQSTETDQTKTEKPEENVFKRAINVVIPKRMKAKKQEDVQQETASVNEIKTEPVQTSTEQQKKNVVKRAINSIIPKRMKTEKQENVQVVQATQTEPVQTSTEQPKKNIVKRAINFIIPKRMKAKKQENVQVVQATQTVPNDFEHKNIKEHIHVHTQTATAEAPQRVSKETQTEFEKKDVQTETIPTDPGEQKQYFSERYPLKNQTHLVITKEIQIEPNDLGHKNNGEQIHVHTETATAKAPQRVVAPTQTAPIASGQTSIEKQNHGQQKFQPLAEILKATVPVQTSTVEKDHVPQKRATTVEVNSYAGNLNPADTKKIPSGKVSSIVQMFENQRNGAIQAAQAAKKDPAVREAHVAR